MSQNSTLTALPGVRVGHWTNKDARTGCTVVTFPDGVSATVEVRGAAPGSRETALLAPGMTVASCHAIVLSGGSAFGLAAADGVMHELRAAEVGFVTRHGVVPIVPAAVIYDLGEGAPDVFPTAADGAAALHAANAEPVAMGRVGAGAGATVGKWRDAPQPGGLGSALAEVGGVRVGALAVVNATGDIFTLDGEAVTGGPSAPGAPVRGSSLDGENTTLVLIATDTPFTPAELSRLVVRAHDAMGVTIRPAHTRVDGDLCFAVSTGSSVEEPVGAEEQARRIDCAGEAAFRAVADAVVAALTG